MVRKIKNIVRKVIFKYVAPEIKLQHNSYAQAGEDLVVDFLVKQISLKPSYLELGVFHASLLSNTYKFYLEGSRGVLVEADRTLITDIKSLRPDDTILNIGVGVSGDSRADFYIFENQGLNTFDRNEAYRREKSGLNKIKETISVELKTINRIIKDNFPTYPDFLSIDIEGLDLAVLKSLDFALYPIPIICAETCSYSENHIKEKDRSIEEFLLTKSYFVYGDTYINTIFVNKAWFYKIR